MPAAVHLRLEPDARLTSHIEGADAFRTVGFVRGQAHQIDWQGREIDIHTTSGLCAIDVKNDSAFTAQPADGFDVLDHTNFVVNEHDADQNRVGPDRRCQRIKIDQPVGLHIQVSDFKTLALKFAASVENSFVLGLDGNDVLAFGLIKVSGTLERKVV